MMRNVFVCVCVRERALVFLLERRKVKSLSCVQLFATPWAVAYQAPPSMGFFWARVLEWAAISFSRRSSQPRDGTQVSCIVGRHFTVWATREVTVSSYGGPNPKSITFMTPCEPHDHLRAPSPNTIILGFRASIWEFRDDTLVPNM